MSAVAPARSAFETSALEAARAIPSGPEWISEIRREALERFARAGLPSPREEEWRSTSLSRLSEIAFVRPHPGRAKLDRDTVARLAPPLEGPRIVLVNGIHAPDLSRAEDPPPGVRIEGLARAFSGNPGSLREAMLRARTAQTGPMEALNSAAFEDGALVEIGPGVVLSEPIVVLHVSGPEREPIASNPRIVLALGRESSATIVEVFAGAGEGVSLTNVVTEVAISENASLEHYRLQEESREAFHLGLLRVEQARDSRYVSHAVSWGAALARTDLRVRFAGPGGECTLDGLFVADGDQHTDNQSRIEHAHPHCASRQLYKGILAGRARGVFHGRILVAPGAQKTDARQTNKNLLLSRQALVDSTPQLEIYADDVKCTHGSTIGQLDEEALYYLRSRGLGEEESRGLLTQAFARDVLDRMKIGPIRSGLSRRLAERLAAVRPSEGGLP
jgi:Fe-S cluster assembly protein SufD